jgi:hypothetical protein
MAGLERLGLACQKRGSLVLVTLDVGPADLGDERLVAADPPSDFPNVPPHWLHLHRGLLLPGGGGQASELGPEWLKWSRPHPKWRGGDHAASRWAAHARALLLTAKVA